VCSVGRLFVGWCWFRGIELIEVEVEVVWCRVVFLVFLPVRQWQAFGLITQSSGALWLSSGFILSSHATKVLLLFYIRENRQSTQKEVEKKRPKDSSSKELKKRTAYVLHLCAIDTMFVGSNGALNTMFGGS